jgi:pectate lyase
LIGHSDDNASEDAGRLNVTLHHNHWAEGVTERMPRVRFGKVHSFNNYFTSSGNNYCLRAGRGGQLLIENNYFQGVSNPHEFNNDEDEPTAHITERGSVYSNTSGLQIRGGGGTPFTSAPYTVTLDAAADVPALVQACVGPR